jgi:hypothetical protein
MLHLFDDAAFSALQQANVQRNTEPDLCRELCRCSTLLKRSGCSAEGRCLSRHGGVGFFFGDHDKLPEKYLRPQVAPDFNSYDFQ